MVEKYQYNKIGVEPDIYIPWTPEHIVEDVDLKVVLDRIKQYNNL